MAGWAFPIGTEVETVDSRWLNDTLSVGRRGVVIAVDSDWLRRDSRWMESRRVAFTDGRGYPDKAWFAVDALRATNVIDRLVELAREAAP